MPKKIGTRTKADVADAVSSVCKALQISPADLAEALGTTRQSVYRWQEGGPAEGPAKLILVGLARRLRETDEGTLEAWGTKLRESLQHYGASLDVLEALVVPPRADQWFRELEQQIEIMRPRIEKAGQVLRDLFDNNPVRKRRRRSVARGGSAPRSKAPK